MSGRERSEEAQNNFLQVALTKKTTPSSSSATAPEAAAATAASATYTHTHIHTQQDRLGAYPVGVRRVLIVCESQRFLSGFGKLLLLGILCGSPQKEREWGRREEGEVKRRLPTEVSKLSGLLLYPTWLVGCSSIEVVRKTSPSSSTYPKKKTKKKGKTKRRRLSKSLKRYLLRRPMNSAVSPLHISCCSYLSSALLPAQFDLQNSSTTNKEATQFSVEIKSTPA